MPKDTKRCPSCERDRPRDAFEGKRLCIECHAMRARRLARKAANRHLPIQKFGRRTA